MNSEIIHSVESEARLLGGCFASYDWANRVTQELTQAHFIDPRNREVFAVIDDMIKNDKKIDFEIVYEKVKLRGVDVNHVVDLRIIANLGLDLDELIQEVVDVYKRREMQGFLRSSSDLLSNEKYKFEIFQQNFEQQYFHLTEDTSKSTISPLKDWLEKPTHFMYVMEERMRLHASGESFCGMPSHFTSLDKILNGFSKGHLIICGARPGVGKTSLATNLLEQFCITNKVPCLLFSLEMPMAEVAEKLIAQTANVSYRKIKEGSLTSKELEQIKAAIKSWEKAHLIIDDQSSLSIDQIFSRARRMKRSHKIECIVIDYVQLVTAPKVTEARYLEIGMISRRLKEIAKTLEVPVIALAQLNREVEKRTDKKPLLSDLRESGSLEADADAVLLLHRPEMYDKNDKPGYMEIYVAKNRFGPTDKVTLRFMRESGKMENDDFHATKNKVEPTQHWSDLGI